jgi:hypothetical protein
MVFVCAKPGTICCGHVKLVVEGQTQEHLIFLLANDTDDVNWWFLMSTVVFLRTN